MKNLFALLFTIVSFSLFGQSYSGPESAEYDYANSRWLIANTTSHQVLARNSSGVLTVFATGLVSGPYGIEIVGDVLYCCSGSSIKGYALSTGENVFNVNVGATFLNGLTHDASGNLYATDFSGKKIYKVITATQAFSVIASSLVQSPNGIVYDQANNRCVFVNWGSNAPIKAIDLTTNTVTTILTTTYSNCDGVSRDAAGNYYISNWGNQSVIKYNSDFTSSPTVVASGLSSPADIFVNTVDNVLAIPNSGNNTVTFVTLPDLGDADFENAVLDKVSISPNPISKLSKLKFDLPTTMHVSGTIYDVNGKVVSQLTFIDKTMQNGEVALAVSELNSGVYYLVFKADDKSKTIPLVVE